jgi:hypothetical protein
MMALKALIGGPPEIFGAGDGRRRVNSGTRRESRGCTGIAVARQPSSAVCTGDSQGSSNAAMIINAPTA